MRCINCGYENDENAHFCIKCGSGLAYNRNPLEGIMTQLVKDSIFTVMCILYTAGIVFLLISRELPIIKILMAIFLWLLYAQCKNGIVDSKYMRCISGTIFASCVVRCVLGCLLVAFGFFLVAVAAMMETSSQWREFYFIISPYIDRYNRIDSIGRGYEYQFLAIMAVVLIMAAIIFIIINVAGMRSIHRLAKSLYKSLNDGKWNIVCGSARTWLMVFGVFTGYAAIMSGEVFSFFGGGCVAAALILGSVLVKKYLKCFE